MPENTKITAQDLSSLKKGRDYATLAATKAEMVHASLKETQFDSGEFHIEMIEPTKVENGVQVFARAFKNGDPVGFGEDGSVEWERFIFMNPPLMVPDDAGDVVRTLVGDKGEKIERRFSVDPALALQQSLAHAITITHKGGKDIVAEKRGNTTTVFFPSLDGYAGTNGHTGSWATLRTAPGAQSSDSDPGTGPTLVTVNTSGDDYDQLLRGICLWDTSALTSGASISAAVASWTANSKNNNAGFNADDLSPNVVASNPASNSAIVNADYTCLSFTSFGEITNTALNVDGTTYNDITLNGSGIANISKTGISKFGVTVRADFGNTSPSHSGSGGQNSRVYFNWSESSGTSIDPKLTVTFTTVSGPANVKTLDGVAAASIKTWNGLAWGSIKTWDGIN